MGDTGVTPEAEQLVTDNIGLAHRLATRRMRRQPRVPAIWCDDVRSAALEGLIKAAEAFDPGRGWKFVTYAQWRINGEMADQLRTLHNGRTTPSGNNWRSRSRESSLDAMAENLHIHGNEPIQISELPIMADPGSDPADLYDTAETGWLAADLLALLNSDQRDLAERYFLHGHTLAEIAQAEGVTESRICQRMTAIKLRLRQLAVRTDLVAA